MVLSFLTKATVSVFLKLKILNPSASLIAQLNPVIKLACNILGVESFPFKSTFFVRDKGFKNLHSASHPQLISFKQES